MIINKVSEIEQSDLNHLFNEFVKNYPERDDNNNLPDNSNIKEVIISPFDHWLSMEEAENEIRGFVKKPTEELQNTFRQNEEKNLCFITKYLESREFYCIETIHTELSEDEYEYKSFFYTCETSSNFYEVIQDTSIFLPILNVFMKIKDDYSIRFEVLKSTTSEAEIESIIKLSKDSGLFVNECK